MNYMNYYGGQFGVVTSTPLQFQNCSIYDPSKDWKYGNCTITDGSDPCTLLREVHRAKEFRRYFLAIIPIVLSIIAFILNVIYLVIQIRAYITEDHSYRKRYVFLIYRTLSTILAIILLYVVLITWKADSFGYTSAMIFILIGASNFLSVTGTYIGLTLLLYVAVRHQFWYRSELRLKHCYFAVAIIWFLSLASSICIGLWGATLFYPETTPVQCSYEGCQRPLAIIIVVGLSICYSTVLLLYIIMLYRLMYRHTDGQSSNSAKIGLLAMKRLGLNMVTFAFGSIPVLIVCIVTLANLRKLSTLGEGKKGDCKTYLYSRLYVEVEILASIAGIVILSAMIIDPIINTVVDHKLMKMVRNGANQVSQSIRSWHGRLSGKSVALDKENNEENNSTTVNNKNDKHVKNSDEESKPKEPSTVTIKDFKNESEDSGNASDSAKSDSKSVN